LLEYVCNENQAFHEHWVGTRSDDQRSEVALSPEKLARYAGIYTERRPHWQDAPVDQQGIKNPLPIAVPMHVHHIVLPYMGMPIIDNAELEGLARTCAELAQWEFQFVCAPLVIPLGTGSPVTPLAIL